jgi:tetratricopeptide (TPR) repeat protein
MFKKVNLVIAALVVVNAGFSQTLAEGQKFLSYQKNKSAKQVFEKLYNNNSKDAQNIYWYGQSMLAAKDIAGAKALYQKALQDGVNEPLIWIGAGHVELLENGDVNSAKQKFEQAITAATPTKGKNKGKTDVAVLNAIGRANADGSSTQGDPNYGIEKLKLAAENDATNAEAFVNMGICYQKLGGEMGGEAVKAYTEATTRNPAYAEAFWRIGTIYASQNNKEQYEQYYNKAIAADEAFPLSYLSYYRVYEQRNVDIAKEYLDKYIKYADKDCATDYFYADYLFRAGKYQESLDKGKIMETGECSTYNRLPVLLAYDYDRLGDSIAAKNYLEKYLDNAKPDETEPTDYELAVKVFGKFPQLITKTLGYLEKAIEKAEKKEDKLNYIKLGADMVAKANMYAEQVKWLQRYNDLKGSMGEYDHYVITNASYLSANYAQTMEYAQKYIAAFPDKPQGYFYNVRAAKALDTTTNPGIAEPAILQQNEYLAKDFEKNKSAIVTNYYYLMVYYVDKKKDYEKGLDYCNKILAIIPDSKEMLDIKKTLETALAKNKGKTTGGK